MTEYFGTVVGKLKLPAALDIVSSGQLMEYLGDCIFENAPNVSAHFESKGSNCN